MGKDLPPYLLSDPYFEGGRKFVISNADARVVFGLLKERFEVGERRDIYRIVLTVEPFIRVRVIMRDISYHFVEALVKQIGDNVSVHLAEYSYNWAPLENSELYFRIAKYLFSRLDRKVPPEILEQLHVKELIVYDRRFLTGLLVFFLIGVGVIGLGLLNAGAVFGIVFIIIPFLVALYYLYNLRKNGLVVEDF